MLEKLEERLTPSAGPQEQYMLDLINRFRDNPAGELALILNANDPNVNNDLAYFGVDRIALSNQLATLTPAPPLAWNDSLAASALAHSQTMLSAQLQSHQVPGELDPWTRMVNAGYTNYSFLAENIFAFAHSVFEAEASLVIDWGSNPPTGIQNPASHRANLIDADLREIGIGMVNAPSGSPMGPLLVTQDFGNRTTIGNPFLLGNVYDDTNHDGFYEPGEGMAGVTLTITGPSGTFQATTTAAGGYQLQVPAGTYQVTASGGGLSAPVTQGITVGTDNRQLDFIRPVVSAPAFTAPAASTTSTTPTFSWTATVGAMQYDLWVNTAAGQQVLRNQSIVATSFTPSTALAAGSYQAWIRVTTAGGTSPWSAAYNFTITALQPPSLTAPTGSSVNTSPTFSWSASPGATYYDLWVENLSTNQIQFIRQPNLATNSFTPTSPLPVGSYVAWVQAYNGAGALGGWSAALNFSIVPPAAPALTGPPATITSTTPTFTWNASAGATQYDFYASTTGLVIQKRVTTTSFTPASPIPRGQYTFWVRAGNSAGVFGAWSAGYNFFIDTTAPAIPTIIGPSSPTANVTPTFTWTTSAGAVRFDLWVNNLTTGQTQVIRQPLSTNSFTPTVAAALKAGSYVAWVEAFDGTNQTRGWSASYYFTITAPAAPSQLAPTGSTSNATPTFSWSAVSGATTYELWVQIGQTRVIDQQGLTTTSYTPSAALTKTSYRFWVRATNAKGDVGNWSAEADFTVV
jgi:uncharacterized protein YkwD